MNKKELTKADIRTKFITPALVGPNGSKWNVMTQLREEVYFTKGRVIVRGKTVKRGEAKKADYIISSLDCRSPWWRPKTILSPSVLACSKRSNTLSSSICHLPIVLTAMLSWSMTAAPSAQTAQPIPRYRPPDGDQFLRPCNEGHH